MTIQKVTTLNEFIHDAQKQFPLSTGDLSGLLTDIRLAAKIVNREVNKAGLVDILGAAGTTNVQEEEVQKLDVFANETFMRSLQVSGRCCGIASEENDDFIVVEGGKDAKYVVMMDPLDGSSNIDVNVSIGTIFSIYKRVTVDGPVTEKDFFQKGTEQVAAGYIVYGSSTMIVFTTGNGVNGFTLDPSIGVFCLSHPNMKIPAGKNYYSINQGNFSKFPEAIKKYIEYCGEEDKASGRPYPLRYIGSMVADIHRNLIKGGVFMYPATKNAPNGKLRLLYECNPIAFLVEQAGGMATAGDKRIMEIEPTELHQRTPIFVGSKEMVKEIENFLNEYSSVVV